MDKHYWYVQRVNEFCVVEKRQSTYFEAHQIRNIRSGLLILSLGIQYAFNQLFKPQELRNESRKEEMVQALMLEQESLRSISEDTKAGPESLELSMEIEEFKDEAVDISAHGKESNKQDKDPISVPSTAMGRY